MYFTLKLFNEEENFKCTLVSLIFYLLFQSYLAHYIKMTNIPYVCLSETVEKLKFTVHCV